MKFFFVALLLVASSDITVAGGEPVAGKTITIICIGCHGTDGNSSNPIYPKLAGQGEGYLAKQIADFKTGARKEEHMTSMVEAVNFTDIPNIAAYFASQKRIGDTADKAKTGLGKQIYHAGIKNKNIPACADCHGQKGMGTPAEKFPSLAGQHAEYVTKVLKDFRSGARSNDPQKMMREVTVRLSDKEIDSFSAYIADLN